MNKSRSEIQELGHSRRSTYHRKVPNQRSRLPVIGAAVVIGALIGVSSPSAAANARPVSSRCTDHVLSEAAGTILLSGSRASHDLLEAARAAGSHAPAFYALRGKLAPTKASRWLERLRDRLGGPVLCGRASGAEETVVVAALGAATLELARNRLTGTVTRAFGDPILVVRTATGEYVRRSVTAQDLAAGIALADELPRPLTVQLVARGPRGPVPVAVLTVSAARTRSTGPPSVAFLGDGEPRELAHRFVRAARAREDLPRLRPNRLLDRAAEAHAAAVCDLGTVTHVTDDGDPEQRVRKVGIRARRVGEVVARSSSLHGALRALIESPSHAMTLLDRRFTDLGSGVARDDAGRVCVVAVLTEWPRFTGR